MELLDALRGLSARVPAKAGVLKTEEATKNALVLPFLNALGYNVFDPTEVVPEFTADVGIKRGEKVDYAIMVGGQPALLFECKCMGADLRIEYASQLYRYFSVTSARFAILTDGVHYKFYTDLDAPNRMDERPFLQFDLRELDERIVHELERFCKARFDIDSIVATASGLKYLNGVRRVLAEEWTNPSDDFVRVISDRVYTGRFTQGVMEQFREIVKRGLRDFISDRVKDRLELAIERSQVDGAGESGEDDDEAEGIDTSDGVVTTENEIEGFYIVKAIVAAEFDAARVFMRDTKSYCGILFDDNNRKPLCRLRFNGSQKYLETFASGKESERHPIDRVNDIFQHREAILAAARGYAG
ncbi:MAG: type I restriction endonuclease [Phycisphaerales bacterium]